MAVHPPVFNTARHRALDSPLPVLRFVEGQFHTVSGYHHVFDIFTGIANTWHSIYLFG